MMEPKKESYNKFDGILITHFVNPHLFWFRTDSSFLLNDKFNLLELNINEYFVKNAEHFRHTYEGSVGEVVAVFMPNLSKWVRAIIDAYVDLVMDGKQVILWAIDHGFPIQSDSKWIKKLPTELAEERVDHIYFGGLSDIVPSELIYSFIDNSTTPTPVESWSDLAIKEFKRYIHESAKLKFIPTKRLNFQYFGRLEVTTYDGVIVDINDILIKINVAMRCAKTFDTDIQNLNTIKIQRYQNNSGHISYRELKKNIITGLEFPAGNHNTVIDHNSMPSKEVAAKIIDWDQRNCDVKNNLEKEATSSVYEYDDDNFDSVSCYSVKDISVRSLGWTKDDLKPSMRKNREEDECMMKHCGRMRSISQDQNKLENTKPLYPALVTMPEKSMTTNENIGVQKYQNQMLNNRKKVLEKIKNTQKKSVTSDIASTCSDETCTSQIPESVVSNFRSLKLKMVQKLQNEAKERERLANESNIPKETLSHVETDKLKNFDNVFDDIDLKNKLKGVDNLFEQEKRKNTKPVMGVKNTQKLEAYNLIPAGFDQSRIRKDLVPQYFDDEPQCVKFKRKTLCMKREGKDAEHW